MTVINTHQTTYADAPCLDCGRTTTVADNEPSENQRCVGCFQAHVRITR